jgi:succinate dehydrogenase flavin-adding protein (antitoxin of CptAB toxin-antitoxin module)
MTNRGKARADSGATGLYILSRPPESRPTMSPEPIELRRKRLIHRSLYTGMKETDILLGAFARAHLPDYDAAALDSYERLLSEPDPAIYEWAIGVSQPPPEHDGALMRQLQGFARNFRS